MSIVTPQTAAFKTLCADVYGDDRTPTLAPPPTDIPNTSERQLFRETVQSVADRAKATMDVTLHNRIDKALALVLAGDVELLPDGTARVASQSQGTVQHLVVNGSCPCRGFVSAPQGWCAHRLAAGIAKRTAQALSLADERLASAPSDVHGDCLTLVDDTCSPPEQVSTLDTALLTPFIVQIHGRPFVQYAGLLLLAHSRGLVRLEAHLVSVTETLALAEATATFADGRVFSEAADASPSNTNAKVALHFPRCALTRAKGRALRDALGVNMVTLEELD